jgi:hypothetical protein
MLEPIITCTNCQTVIPLTETLARPYIEAERKKMDDEIRERATAFEKRDAEFDRRTQELTALDRKLHEDAAAIEKSVLQRLGEERAEISAAEAKKAESQFRAQLEQARSENKQQTVRMAELEKAELEYRNKSVAIDEEKRQIELTLARRLDEERENIRLRAIEDQQKHHRLESEAKDRELSDLNAKLLEAQQAELAVREERQALDSEKQAFELEVARTLDVERESIRLQVTEEQQRCHQLELETKDRALSELNAKFLEAQQSELAVRRDRQALESEKQAFELEVVRKLDEERKLIREATQKEDDEQHRFKLAEKDKVIDDMRKQVEELRRKSDQGSQQLQGEVQELELEAILKCAFPRDEIVPVVVGRAGSDVLQKVVGPNGLTCGTILWESKRTKNWSDTWLAKNRDDQRAAGAHLGVIVSATLPDDVEGFDRKEGVWVVGFPLAVGLGRALRQQVIETALARVSGVDRDGKSNRVYAYVTGQEFRQRVGAVVDAYFALRKEIETEKRTHKIRWARQEQNLDLLLDGTGRLYGDLQGIVGKSMPEIDGLEDLEIEAGKDQSGVLDQGDQQLAPALALSATS